MKKLLDPKVDYIFKNLFGTESNSSLLIFLLNSILDSNDKAEEIHEIHIDNTELGKKFKHEKISRLDIVATTCSGMKINIEIQLNNEYNMVSRTVFYWSKLYTSQLSSSDNYKKLKKTISINILDFNYLEDENYHTYYHLKEGKSNRTLTEILEVHFIELRKLDINKYKTINDVEIKGSSDKLLPWALFLKEPESEVVQMLEQRMKELKKAAEELDKMSHDKKNIQEYEYRQKLIHDEISNLVGAKEKGLEQGLELGLEQGKKEGKEEERLKIIVKLIGISLDIKAIALITGLSEEEILEIKKSCKLN